MTSVISGHVPTSALVIEKNWQSGAYRRANKTYHIKICHKKLVSLQGA